MRGLESCCSGTSRNKDRRKQSQRRCIVKWESLSTFYFVDRIPMRTRAILRAWEWVANRPQRWVPLLVFVVVTYYSSIVSDVDRFVEARIGFPPLKPSDGPPWYFIREDFCGIIHLTQRRRLL